MKKRSVDGREDGAGVKRGAGGGDEGGGGGGEGIERHVRRLNSGRKIAEGWKNRVQEGETLHREYCSRSCRLLRRSNRRTPAKGFVIRPLPVSTRAT